MKRAGPPPLGLLLVANALPIGVGLTVLVLYMRGEVQLRSLPKESVGTLAALGVALAGMVALGSRSRTPSSSSSRR